MAARDRFASAIGRQGPSAARQRFFLRHPGTVLTRSQIIEAVWDFAYDGTSNVVDQYVNYLRRKVDIPFARRDIETVRGMGYRLRHEDAG